jgi:galactonate dehydratase
MAPATSDLQPEKDTLMKITGVETKIVHAIHRNWIFVKVLTDQPGLYGWGEATLEWKTRAVVGAIEDLATFVIGEDPRRIEHLVRKMQMHSFWPLGVIGLSAISGIEMALHDITAKDLGVPVWRLLGGQSRDWVRVYTHFQRGKIGAQVNPKDIESYVAGVEATVAMGYKAVKLGVVPYTHYDAPIPEVKHVAKLVERIRLAVGDEIDIMFDFHGRCGSISAAVAYIDAISPMRPLFVEEPIQPGDNEAMALVASKVQAPLATGERLFTPREFFDLAVHKAVSLVQPDLCHVGGFTMGRKIAAIAEVGHMGVAPHNPLGPISGAAALHFAVATPNFVIQEEARGLVDWYDEVVQHPIVLENGRWAVPTSPGLGVELDEDAAAKHPFEPEVIPAREALSEDGAILNW